MTLQLDCQWAEKHLDMNALRRETAAALTLYDDFREDPGPDRAVDGWVAPDESAVQLEDIRDKAREVRENADVFVLVGVGGSNQAARAVIEAMDGRGGPEILYAGNTLSPHALAAVMRRLEGKSVYVNVIAKNFATLEPGSHYRMLRHWLAQRYDAAEMARRFILTGSKGSRLEEMARERGNLFLEFPERVGGRFSAFTPVGLFPVAAAGLDIDALLAGARSVHGGLRDGYGEMAATYAAARHMLLDKGFTVEMFASFEPRLSWFAKWWLQLFGESEGKEHTGIFPAIGEYSEDLHAIGQYMQDGGRFLMETFLSVREQEAPLSFVADPGARDGFDYLDGKDFADINRAAEQGTIEAHAEGGVPCLRLVMDRVDEYHFGQLFYFFMTAVVMSGFLLGVNPFDQDGVERYKARMFRALGKS